MKDISSRVVPKNKINILLGGDPHQLCELFFSHARYFVILGHIKYK